MEREENGFEPMQSDVEQKEVEKKPKIISVDSEGRVKYSDNFDYVDRCLFAQITEAPELMSEDVGGDYFYSPPKGRFSHFLAKILAERLGYTYEESTEKFYKNYYKFNRVVDSKKYEYTIIDYWQLKNHEFGHTPVRKNATLIRFVQQDYSFNWDMHSQEEMRIRFEDYCRSKGTRYPSNRDIEQYAGPFFTYRVESDISDLDKDMITVFTRKVGSLSKRIGFSDPDRMIDFKAAQELARRLGYKVEIEE